MDLAVSDTDERGTGGTSREAAVNSRTAPMTAERMPSGLADVTPRLGERGGKKTRAGDGADEAVGAALVLLEHGRYLPFE